MTLSKAKIKAIFKAEYGNSKNFITNEILDYVFISDRMVAELSFAEGNPTSPLFKSDVWGVTVLVKKRIKWHRPPVTDSRVPEGEPKLSDCFFSSEDAWDHLANLRRLEDTTEHHKMLKIFADEINKAIT